MYLIDTQLQTTSTPQPVFLWTRRLWLAFSLLAMIAAGLIFSGSSAKAQRSANYAGVFRFQGFANKCIDVAGYPLGRTSGVTLFTCNGTAAQDLTLVPFEAPVDGTVEIHAQGRCIGVVKYEAFLGTPEAARVPKSEIIVGRPVPSAGWLLQLQPCDGTTTQRFYVPQSGTIIIPRDNTKLAVTVAGGGSANLTPLALEPIQNLSYQRWTLQPFDTTAYDFPTPRETTGSYIFQGFNGQCIDVGGSTPPDHSPVFVFGCNGTIAQSFALKSVSDHFGYFTIGAFGKCFDVVGGTIALGAAIEINPCTGAPSQRFQFDHYDRNYIYPAGRPDLVFAASGTTTSTAAASS
jgi:hypothetical protein